MAGLIEKGMGGEHPPGEHTMPDGTVMDGDQVVEDAEGGPDPEQDPAFLGALKFSMQALYENGAADGIARSLVADPSANNLSDSAYKIVQIVDERTDASVPEELLAVLAMQVLKEVVDIGEAAGVEFRPSDISTAFRDMVLRFVEESGYDSTELRAAMQQVDPAQFDQAAQADGMQQDVVEGEEVPV